MSISTCLFICLCGMSTYVPLQRYICIFITCICKKFLLISISTVSKVTQGKVSPFSSTIKTGCFVLFQHTVYRNETGWKFNFYCPDRAIKFYLLLFPLHLESNKNKTPCFIFVRKNKLNFFWPEGRIVRINITVFRY